MFPKMLDVGSDGHVDYTKERQIAATRHVSWAQKVSKLLLRLRPRL